MNWKKVIIALVLGTIVVLGAIFAYTLLTTRSHSPADTATYTGNDLTVSVTYSRPYKKGRVIFGSTEDNALLSYGEYWRTGANEATEITLNRDVLWGGQPLDSGSYVLYTIPGPERWTIGLNNELGRWGAWEVDHKNDVLQIEVPSTTIADTVEQFTINFSEDVKGIMLHLLWDNTQVSVPISLPSAKLPENQIESDSTSSPGQMP